MTVRSGLARFWRSMTGPATARANRDAEIVATENFIVESLR